MTKRAKLTRDELELILTCLDYIGAGEISGGPLQGVNGEEEGPSVDRKLALFAMARSKLEAMWGGALV